MIIPSFVQGNSVPPTAKPSNHAEYYLQSWYYPYNLAKVGLTLVTIFLNLPNHGRLYI